MSSLTPINYFKPEAQQLPQKTRHPKRKADKTAIQTEKAAKRVRFAEPKRENSRPSNLPAPGSYAPKPPAQYLHAMESHPIKVESPVASAPSTSAPPHNLLLAAFINACGTPSESRFWNSAPSRLAQLPDGSYYVPASAQDVSSLIAQLIRE